MPDWDDLDDCRRDCVAYQQLCDLICDAELTCPDMRPVKIPNTGRGGNLYRTEYRPCGRCATCLLNEKAGCR